MRTFRVSSGRRNPGGQAVALLLLFVCRHKTGVRGLHSTSHVCTHWSLMHSCTCTCRPVLSQQQASVLTSTFSVRDSLQSLRSSRVFKQAREPVEPPKPEPTKQHVRPTGNTRDRPVLQPLSTQHRVGTSSRASSCGSNSALQAQPSHRSSCSSLDSAVNQVLSPTDEGGRFCIADTGRSPQAAESKPAAVSASLRIPQVADSCCELLQLLQMEEESPTCSRAASSSCEHAVPVRAVQAPAPSKPAAAPVASKPAVRSQPAARSTLPPQAHAPAGKAVSRAAVAAPVGKGPAPAPKPRPRVGSAEPVLPNRVPAAAAAAKQQRRRVGEAAGSGAGATATKTGHGLGLRRAAAAGAPKQQHVEHRQTAAAVGQPVGMLDAALQQRVHQHHVVEQPAAQEAALCQTCDWDAAPLSLPTAWSRVVQPQVQPEAPEIVDMRNKLLAMQQQLVALQQQVGQRPALQLPAAPAVQELLPPATRQQQQQQEEEEASTAGGDSILHDALPLQDGSDLQQQHDSGNMGSAAACAGSTVQTQGLLPPAQSQEQQQDADQRAASAGAELQRYQQGDCCKQQQHPVQQQQGAVHVPGEQQQQQENVDQQQPPAFQQQQQQPNTRHFGAAVTNSQQQQQQSSTYNKLLQATRALVDNSHWQATSLQMRPGGSSPLKVGCSSGRLGGGLGRSAAGGVLGGSPALSKQLSRLSVSQSWGGASPGPTPRPCPAPAALPQLDMRAGASAAGLGEAVRARLFGPALGAVPGALLESQSPAAVDKAVGSLGPGCGSIATLGHQIALPQPALTACSSPFHSGAFSSRSLSAAAAAAHQQLNTILPPLSPAGRSSRSMMLCTSRVAHVLYGTPSKQPCGLPASQPSVLSEAAGHNADKQQGTGAGGCSSSMAVAEGVGCSATATGCRHVGESANLTCSGVASQPDSDDETDLGCQPQGDVQRCRLQAPGQHDGSQAASAGGKQPSQQTAGLTGSYEHQQEEQECCWTVHTNWAADLDAETAAVAAAAAAAAGLSAQLGRGRAVRLQDHSSPFNPAQLHCAGSVHGSPALGLAGCSPVWVPVGGTQQPQRHPEMGASPVSLMVPRKLWGSPPLAEAGE